MKSRRGITTIVATVFLIAVVVASLTYITYSLELMANFSEKLVTEESRKKAIQDESFELTFVNVTDSETTFKPPTDLKLKSVPCISISTCLGFNLVIDNISLSELSKSIQLPLSPFQITRWAL